MITKVHGSFMFLLRLIGFSSEGGKSDTSSIASSALRIRLEVGVGL